MNKCSIVGSILIILTVCVIGYRMMTPSFYKEILVSCNKQLNGDYAYHSTQHLIEEDNTSFTTEENIYNKHYCKYDYYGIKNAKY